MVKESKSPNFSREVRERAVRMVFEHRSEHASQWAAIVSIAAKIGCTAETLRIPVGEPDRARSGQEAWGYDRRARTHEGA